MPSLCFALLLLFLFLCSFAFTSTLSFHTDHQSLLPFKNLITTDPHHSMADWNSANPFCNWTGVACSRRHPNRVVSLHLTGLDLRGPISPSLGNLSFLRSLVLWGNALHGPIPPQLGDLFRLRYLRLDNNELEGSIPPQLGRCRNLTLLALSWNNLTGSIPRELGSLPYLQQLYLGSNDLTGTIPTSLANLSSLIELGLEYNSLIGPIPSQLSSCTNLTELELWSNNLVGNIPHELGFLPHLQFLYLDANNLTGTIPSSFDNLSSLTELVLSENHLREPIPPQLGLLTRLQILGLDENDFSGTIPLVFSNISTLTFLDMSKNFLSGTIPITLKKLKMLQYLNLSFNNLTGEIPKGGFFGNRTIAMSLVGNPCLCGPQEFQLPACPSPKAHFSFLKRVLLSVSGAIVFILCSILLGFYWKWNTHKQNFDSSQPIFQKLEHQRISYQELHIATNGFSEANLLGTGSSGSVYKGILSDDTPVAIKVFHQQNEKVEKSFRAECSVLQKVRHRNLVRIITSCSNLHFKGLVFPFMSNKSLEKHLYPNIDDNNGEDVCQLGLKTRLDIAIDVAHAMEYLHHDSHVQVVHCDLKPNNVLLNEDMTGHVTDFGISKLIDAASTDSFTSTISLKGSMGYIAPEYGLGEAVSIKGDIYSYGILLLEILTRKRPTSDMFSGDLNLHKWVDQAFPNRVKEVIDHSLFSEVDEDDFEGNNVCKCIFSLLQVGLLCSNDSPNDRPTMRDVVMVLESLKEGLETNTVASRRSRRSISNLLSNTNATRNDAHASNAQSSSTF